MLPPFLREFRSHYPQVQIDLREATSDRQLEDLAQGRPRGGAARAAALRDVGRPLPAASRGHGLALARAEDR